MVVAKVEGKLVGGGSIGAYACGFGGDCEVFGAYLGGEKGTCMTEGVENVSGEPSRPLDNVVYPAAGGDAREKDLWTEDRMEWRTQRARSLEPRIPATSDRWGRIGALVHWWCPRRTLGERWIIISNTRIWGG